MNARWLIAPLLASCFFATLSTPAARAVDAATDRFIWTTPTSLPAARSRPAVAVGHDGNVYVFGGWIASNGFYSVTNTTFIYNPRTGRWSQGTAMPIAMEGGAAVTLADGRIAVLGGGAGCFNTQACAIFQTVQVYNPRTHSWCLFAPMRSPRYLFAAVLGVDGRIYAIGGWNGREPMASVEAYDARANTWNPVTSLPHAEEAVAATVTRGRIVVIGGADGTASGFTMPYNDLFVYNGHRWISGSPMPTPRFDFGIAINPRGQIYAIGGFVSNGGSLTYLRTVESYDPATDSWSTVTPLPRALGSLRAVTGPEGHIYTIGGYNGAPVATVFAYRLRTAQDNPFKSLQIQQGGIRHGGAGGG